MRAIGLALLVAVLATGCSNKNDGKPKFGIVTNNAEDFWILAEKGAMKAGTDFNCEVSFKKPANGTVDEQHKFIQDFTNQGFEGIGVSVINPADQSKRLKQLSGAMTLVTMDNDAVESGRVGYVGTDNVAAGKSAGRLVAKALPEGGTVAFFVGQMSALNAQERFRGVCEELEAIGKKKNVKYVIFNGKPFTDEISRDKCFNNANTALEEILKTEKRICLVGLYAYNPPELVRSVERNGMKGKVKVVGFDEMEKTLQFIESGDIEGTIIQDPFNFGYKTIELLMAEKNKDQSKRDKGTIPHRIITKDGKVPEGETAKGLTIADFNKDLAEKTGSK